MSRKILIDVVVVDDAGVVHTPPVRETNVDGAALCRSGRPGRTPRVGAERRGQRGDVTCEGCLAKVAEFEEADTVTAMELAGMEPLPAETVAALRRAGMRVVP